MRSGNPLFLKKTVGMEELITQKSPPGTENFKESTKKEFRGLYQRHLLPSNSKKFKNIKDELLPKYELRRYLKENSVHRSTLSKLRTHSHCLFISRLLCSMQKLQFSKYRNPFTLFT